MKQGYNSRLNESMGVRNRKTKGKATMKARRNESKGEKKSVGRRAYSAVSTMDRKRRGGMSCKRGGMSRKRGGNKHKRTHRKRSKSFLERLGF